MSTSTSTSTAKKEEENGLVEVTWSGKKIFLQKSKLDEWFHDASFEERVDYVESHPYIKQIPLHHFQDVPKESPPDPENYVMVHWSGNKAIMLPRQQLDDWYDGSYEQHVDYVLKVRVRKILYCVRLYT